MPRLENSGEEVSKWCAETGNGSSTHDVCCDCAIDPPKPQEKEAKENLHLYNGDPPGTEWEETDHPPYNEVDYSCALCGKELTNYDN